MARPMIIVFSLALALVLACGQDDLNTCDEKGEVNDCCNDDSDCTDEFTYCYLTDASNEVCGGSCRLTGRGQAILQARERSAEADPE